MHIKDYFIIEKEEKLSPLEKKSISAIIGMICNYM